MYHVGVSVGIDKKGKLLKLLKLFKLLKLLKLLELFKLLKQQNFALEIQFFFKIWTKKGNS